jgi:hypothetical protein
LKSFNFWIFKIFILAAILKIYKQGAQLWVMIYFCVKFQKDPLHGFRETVRTKLMRKKKEE